MRNIGIDATNIKAGGGLTHLVGLITNYMTNTENKLVLFASSAVLNIFPDSQFLVKVNHPWLNKGSFYNTLWRFLLLGRSAKKHGVSIIFTPGGNIIFFRRYISMSQNMLVFESKERNRFPDFRDRLRYILLEFMQVISFYFSSGIIFISEYARDLILNKYKFLSHKKTTVIYHGVDERFGSFSKRIYKIEENFTPQRPFKLLYVSIINYYKHQDKLIEAVVSLKKKSIPVELHLIGPVNPKLKKHFDNLILSAAGAVIYHGKVKYEDIHQYYSYFDLFVFASTCENMPNILVEAMNSHLPVLCSNYGPMPEILKNGGLYFDPLDSKEISDKILFLMNSKKLRTKYSEMSGSIGSGFSWRKCSDQTFKFIKSAMV